MKVDTFNSGNFPGVFSPEINKFLGTYSHSLSRIGIGKVHPSVTTDYVLSRFAPDERESAEEALTAAADAVERWLAKGIDAAMNEFNPKRGSKSPGRQPAEDDPSQGELS